jgi:hypothetical protein
MGKTRSRGERGGLWATTTVVVAAAGLAAAPGARAVSDEEELGRFGEEGTAAGQLRLPQGLATELATGRLYVADLGNHRIDEFTPWGEFAMAFGWDVAPGAVNETQEVRVRAAGGQFKLSFEGEASASLPFDASAAEVQGALNGLAKVSAGGGSVSVTENPGTADGKTPYIYVVAFKGAPLAGKDVPQLEGTEELSGGVPATELEVNTRADGHPSTTGLEACTAESGCQAGLGGAGAGELGQATGIAVDEAGDVFVKEIDNRRVQKFDSAGRFLLMFGGEVDKTTSANRCTAADLEGGDECGAGTAGAGPGQFADAFGRGVAICPGGKLYAADLERVQRFNLEGEFQAAAPVPGELVEYLACEPISGNLWAKLGSGGDLHELDPVTGNEVGGIEDEEAGPVATDPAANVYTTGKEQAKKEEEEEHKGSFGIGVLQFDHTGKALTPPSCCEAEAVPPPFNGHFGVEALATNPIGDLYVAYGSSGIDSFIRAFGPGPTSYEGPPPRPPEIRSQFATSVQSDGATVAAQINPHFFTDTRYFVQYGTGKCSEEGGCPLQEPAPPGALLSSKPFGQPVRTAGVALQGLQAGTTYHYRFVAESSGGGPVYGIDPDGPEGPEEASQESGLEASFTTYDPLPSRPCPNDALRGGAGAQLPDCRAYEMVSPVDKNNGDIFSIADVPSYSNSLSQSAADGDKLTYSSYRSFADPEAAPFTNQYLASRDPGSGWSSEAIDPPEEASISFTNSNIEGVTENRYKAFSANLCQGWLVLTAPPLLAPGAVVGKSELYRRELCGGGEEGSYEALAGTDAGAALEPVMQGASADGGETVLLAKDLSEAGWRAYYASEGGLAPVCILPSGAPSAGNCSAGWSRAGVAKEGTRPLERLATLTNAISEDGSKVYWTDFGEGSAKYGQVYLRENPGEEQSALSGETCTEPEKACTVAVSGTKTSKASQFLAGSADGTKALFEVREGTLEGRLFEFSLGGATREVAGKVIGLAAASEDLSRIYFVSEEALAPEATAGRPNLYLDEGGQKNFVATLSRTDVGANLPSDADPEGVFHAARATPDGSALAFISTEPLSGYDNTDQQSKLSCGERDGSREGTCDSEVFLYEAEAGKLVCVSCNPGGARPRGRVVQVTGNRGTLDTAASLAMPTTSLYLPRSLSANGKRLLFNSFDPLVPGDDNGAEDAYEWEAASSRAECEEKGAELYLPAAEGCLSLISSGQSAEDSELLDASESGDDAFFATSASLLARDPGLIDIYDARVGGGFPEPPPPPKCQGETCKPPPASPEAQTPSSSSYEGPEGKRRHRHHHHRKRHRHRKHGGGR